MRVLGIASAVLILLGLGIWWWLQPSDFVLVVKVLDNQTGESDPTDVGRFTVQLSNNPRNTINLQLSSSSPDQGDPELDSLTFTGSNWHHRWHTWWPHGWSQTLTENENEGWRGRFRIKFLAVQQVPMRTRVK
mgnify:CR=1 FL=1